MPQKRRRKRSKFAPLVWILTAAVIAFFVAFSNTYKSIPFFQKSPQTNAQAPVFNLTNLLPGITPVQNVSSSISSQGESSKISIIAPTNIVTNTGQPVVRVKIYLAKQGASDISLVEKIVEIPRTQALLKDTLQTLIGYNDEKLLNLVPIHTKIRKIWIKDGIAHIDLSDEFSYNSNGPVGYKVQVYQIVYTAAQFASVKAVTFYIEGKLAQYLGGDGYPLNNPIYPYSYLPKFPLQ